MNYTSGEVVVVGDNVLIENRRTSATVDVIIESHMDKENYSVEEIGTILGSEPFGSVFWPCSETVDPMVFVSRGPKISKS